MDNLKEKAAGMFLKTMGIDAANPMAGLKPMIKAEIEPKIVAWMLKAQELLLLPDEDHVAWNHVVRGPNMGAYLVAMKVGEHGDPIFSRPLGINAVPFEDFIFGDFVNIDLEKLISNRKIDAGLEASTTNPGE